MNPKRKLPSELADVFLPMIIALVLYFGVLNAPFLYDDSLYVVENTLIREVSNAPRLWITPYHQSGLYRPVTNTSFLRRRENQSFNAGSQCRALVKNRNDHGKFRHLNRT